MSAQNNIIDNLSVQSVGIAIGTVTLYRVFIVRLK